MHATHRRDEKGPPRLLICDEATSALDTTIQAQVVVLLQELRRQIGFACLFITHDLALAESLCDTIYVMADGAIAERLSSGNMAAEAKTPATLVLSFRRQAIEGSGIKENGVRTNNRANAVTFIPRPALRTICGREPHDA